MNPNKVRVLGGTEGSIKCEAVVERYFLIWNVGIIEVQGRCCWISGDFISNL